MRIILNIIKTSGTEIQSEFNSVEKCTEFLKGIVDDEKAEVSKEEIEIKKSSKPKKYGEETFN